MTQKKCYKVKKIDSWLYGIFDPLGVYCYLAVGSESALLFDTAYGIADLNDIIWQITDLPVTVVIGHGHVDHVSGAYQFQSAYMNDKDAYVCSYQTGRGYRQSSYDRFLEQFEFPQGFDPDEFLKSGAGNIKSMKPGMTFDLGGLRGEAVELAGHTAGSTGLLFKEKKTMLVGDSFNDHMWLFFEESLPIKEYIETLKRVDKLDFDTFFIGHRGEPVSKNMIEKFIQTAQAAAIEKALPYNFYPALKPYIFEKYGVSIVFNAKKL